MKYSSLICQKIVKKHNSFTAISPTPQIPVSLHKAETNSMHLLHRSITELGTLMLFSLYQIDCILCSHISYYSYKLVTNPIQDMVVNMLTLIAKCHVNIFVCKMWDRGSMRSWKAHPKHKQILFDTHWKGMKSKSECTRAQTEGYENNKNLTCCLYITLQQLVDWHVLFITHCHVVTYQNYHFWLKMKMPQNWHFRIWPRMKQVSAKKKSQTKLHNQFWAKAKLHAVF